MNPIEIVAGPDVFADRPTADALVAEALTARGRTGGIVDRASGSGEVIVVPGSGRPVDTSEYESVVRVDLGTAAPDRSDGIRAHIRARGLGGLRYAIDTVHFHRLHPARVVTYGEHVDQRIDVRTPEGGGPFPVAVLVHGGYWRTPWELDSLDAMAVDLTARGYATCNVEYRRPDEHGWDTTRADIAAALEAARSEFPSSKVVVFGHSAGGQLALRLAADAAPKPDVAVSLAGVLDLKIADERWLGDGAVSNAIGGRYDDAREIYEASSPRALLPLGMPQIVACALSDDPNLLEIARAYVAAARAAGDEVRWVDGPGGHFAVVDPDAQIYRDLVGAVDEALG